MKANIVATNPKILSGTPVFQGTRVPVQTFWDYLDEGQTIENFLQDFPTVSQKQIHQLLTKVRQQTTAVDYDQVQNFA